MKIILSIIVIIFIFLIYLSCQVSKKKNKKINVIDIEDINYYNETILSNNSNICNPNYNNIIEPVNLDHYVLNKLLDEEIDNIDDYKLVLSINDHISIIKDYEEELKMQDINDMIELTEQIRRDRNPNHNIVINVNDQNYFNDVQRALSDNVHDRNIQEITVANYNKLQKNKVKKNKTDEEDKEIDNIINDTPNTFEEYLKNRPNSEHTNNLYKQIKNRNMTIMNLENKTELEIINDVWDDINKIDDGEDKEKKKELLVNAIEECTEDGIHIVCSSGVSSRIINFNILESNLISNDILRTELLNTASKLTTDLLEDEKYNNATDDEQKKIFKDKFEEKVKEDYKDSNIDEKIIKKEINLWIESI